MELASYILLPLNSASLVSDKTLNKHKNAVNHTSVLLYECTSISMLHWPMLINGKCSPWRVQVLWGDSGDIKAAVHHLLRFPSDCWTSGTLDQTAPAWNLISSLHIKIRAMLFGLTLECTLNTFRNTTSFFCLRVLLWMQKAWMSLLFIDF